MEVTNNNHEKAGDNTDVNIQNSNCFARCKKNLISLKAEEIVLLKELTTGEIITVIKRIKSVEETQSRDEVKHLIEENSSKNCNNKDFIRKYKPPYKPILPILPIHSFNKTTLHKYQNILIMLLLDHQRSR